jgi:exodeoxyribonuclease VII small subunit
VTSKDVSQKLGFEESLERLEKIVLMLERGEVTLEESLQHFEEGVALTRRCHELLAAAEKRVSRLVREEEGGLTLQLFPTEPQDTG